VRRPDQVEQALLVGYGIQLLIDNGLFRFGLTPMQIF
jgi:hypothetical protein